MTQSDRAVAIAEHHLLDAPPPALLALAELAALATGARRAAVDVVTDSERHRAAAYGLPGSACPREQALAEEVVTRGGPVVRADLASDDPPPAGEPPDVTGYAGHPLVTPEGVTVGALGVYDAPAADAERTARLLELLAGRATDALALAALTRRLAQTRQQLTAYAGQVSHDLKNPLSATRMSLELAREELGSEGDPEVLGLLARAERGTERMEGIINDRLASAEHDDDAE